MFRSVRDVDEIVPYSPRFHDGWSPGVISFFPEEDITIHTAVERPLAHTGLDQNQSSRKRSLNEDFDTFRDELMSSGAKIGLVITTRDAQSSKELSIIKGEYLEVNLFSADLENLWKTFSLVVPPEKGKC